MARQQEEEVGVVCEELQGQRDAGVAPHRIVPAAHAQHRHRHLVHVTQRVVPLPVCLPAVLVLGCTASRRPLVAEQCLLQGPQGAAGEQVVSVQHLPQSRPVPTARVDINIHYRLTQ
uniref:Uncharacterized protein n=1 Tax=Paramormyrops kingsleyae TaxID=1676925 RepID=A0A3B3RQE3_9TELE